MIFIKLSYELENVAAVSVLLILLTIAIGYVLIQIFETAFLGGLIDPNLIGIGAMSVFNLNAFLMLIGACAILLVFEIVLKFSRFGCKGYMTTQ